ncbi:hypothetical protein CLAFUW4_13868 [Fulvia fulva]|uniref:Uncharacterized protein n=1 Tax=Passalora fulva TaxID=5499 RepID=A0A9Q8PLA9_PASFU|nr:uncharacterized protein CLAFUR5_13711 [Fulvia fulva]KAK4610051.1 hypothetical protein CLAFUR4_13871 [Fulvia fulva]KAK4611337.1 hypothetical protein CLAFUR0_13875 [Fulvia fulva]UJO24487.1 hypothetical protein CLAFUR5_13711 [Fulvia fulva]WPV22038.1 hypothetical protein CLAFUW4_13868 [Fulvia fulva]WPV37018.1 hypothetical protein CLAFUW7_13876 [Fulvia fulva]
MAAVFGLKSRMTRMEHLHAQMIQVGISTETLDRDLRVLRRGLILRFGDDVRVKELIAIANFSLEAAERMLDMQKEDRNPAER